MPQYKFSLVACARWEEANIQEWLEYHRAIGFDHVYLYSNDDDPTALFRAVAPYVSGFDPFVTFRHWPYVGQQTQIYLHFLETSRHETEWFSFLDIDEFFVLKGVNDIFAFMLDYEAQVDCLYFNWVIHGNNGKVRRDDASTLMSYTRRGRQPDAHTKMLCRAARLDPEAIRYGERNGRGAFWHFLDNYKLPGVRCRDVLGGSTDGYSADFPASTVPFTSRPGFAEGVLDTAYVAHFQFRSEEDFIRRWRRGGFPNGEQWRAAYETGVHKAILANNNVVYDTYLADFWYHYTGAASRCSLRPDETPPPGENVALNKPSWQSTIFEPDDPEPLPCRFVGGGNNGLRTGTYGFHTRYQVQPWWIVDLLGVYEITELRIYNRGTGDPVIAARANEMDILLSDDGKAWMMLHSRQEVEPFGLDGRPLVVPARDGLTGRFVMLRLRSAACLHLDEVEIYGRPVGVSPSMPRDWSGPVISGE